MNKLSSIAIVCLILQGCMSSHVGMTRNEYVSACRTATWKTPQIKTLSSGEVLMDCVGDTDNNYAVFNNNTLTQYISTEQVTAMIEHEQCVGWGTEYGTQGYTNCRISLAQIRAQNETALAAQRQASLAAMGAMGLSILNQNQPRPSYDNSVRVQSNCTGFQTGQYISWQCR